MSDDTLPKFQIPNQEHIDEAHGDDIYAFQIRGETLITASRDQTVRKWSLKSARLMLPPFKGHTGSVLCVQFDDEENLVVSGSADATLRVWDMSTGVTTSTLRGHADSVLSLHFDRDYLVSGGRDKTVKVWSRRKISDPTSLSLCLDSPSSFDSTIEPYTCLMTLNHPQAAVNAVRLHGNTLISGSGDRQIHVVDLQTGQTTRTLSAHRSGIADLHTNGRLLLSASSDHTASIHDVESGMEKGRLTGHTSLIRAVDAVSDDASGEFARIVTGGYDGTVRVWEKDAQRQWTLKRVLDYGMPTSGHISDQNPYVHDHEEGLRRVFDVHVDEERVVCSGQGMVIVGWNLTGL